MLLYGVTGLGQDGGVFCGDAAGAGCRQESALLLVPEIGLTPAMAGQMYAAFGDEVALLHSGLDAG